MPIPNPLVISRGLLSERRVVDGLQAIADGAVLALETWAQFCALQGFNGCYRVWV